MLTDNDYLSSVDAIDPFRPYARGSGPSRLGDCKISNHVRAASTGVGKLRTETHWFVSNHKVLALEDNARQCRAPRRGPVVANGGIAPCSPTKCGVPSTLLFEVRALGYSGRQCSTLQITSGVKYYVAGEEWLWFARRKQWDEKAWEFHLQNQTRLTLAQLLENSTLGKPLHSRTLAIAQRFGHLIRHDRSESHPYTVRLARLDVENFS